MITYELARQLEEAGFPQKSYVGANFYVNKSLNTTLVMGTGEKSYWENEVFAPTLSELIEACPPYRAAPENISPFSSIAGLSSEFNLHATQIDGNVEWHAGYGYPYHNFEADVLESGNTPEEAVAGLWLAINDKKS